MPVLLFTYVLQFMDKTSLANASVMGIIVDTHLVGQEFSWLSSVFYFGYLFANLPVSVLLVKFPLGKTLGTAVYGPQTSECETLN
ncbi:major facilitator superfamily domain-containing protein [Penicillium cinerascens]|uniref:Major facilitator superfamily domain-containing protein n=1 Tax=Penicillium cinerascens TaxID=70096 RepID=A0A9W9J619_9EURO|nr:major facilitator superfamily domain-containing protein [Penicillium cinerascens]KAJ5191248.1 major facilitator superfamily domain-containing protein [Penicillium cinerascens]